MEKIKEVLKKIWGYIVGIASVLLTIAGAVIFAIVNKSVKTRKIDKKIKKNEIMEDKIEKTIDVANNNASLYDEFVRSNERKRNKKN